MGLLRRGKSEEEKADKHYRQEMALAEESGPQMPGQPEAYASLGRSVYMVMAPEVDQIILKNPILAPIYPAFCHLMRLTRIGKTQAQILELDFENILRVAKMNMPEDKYEKSLWLALEALKMLAQSIITDSVGGFKANIVTNLLKTIRTELTEVKKKRGPF